MVVITLLLFVGYFGVLPMFWPEPSAHVEYPAQVRKGRDIEITVRVSAWHPLFHVNRIRLVPDLERSSAVNPTDPFTPLQPFGVSPRRYGYGDMFKRFTWPVTRVRTVRVALSDEHVAGKLQPGELRGTFDVSYTHAVYHHRIISSREGVERVPFSIQVVRAD